MRVLDLPLRLVIGRLSINSEIVEVVVKPITFSFSSFYVQSFSLSDHLAYNDNLWVLFSFF